LLAELATLSRNTRALAKALDDTFLHYPQPTSLQTRAFDRLGISSRL
jgi:hypothetical protein